MGKKSKSKTDQPKDLVTTEDRFAAAETRPQFRSVKKNQSKVVLDDRFSSVLTDPRFQLEGKDKYGRRNKTKHAAKEELSAFYTIKGDDDDDDDKDKDKKNGESKVGQGSNDSDDNSSASKDPAKARKEEKSESEDDNENEDPASRIAYLTALSRGELAMSSSSEDDDDSQSSDDDEGEEGEDPVHGTAGVLDPANNKEEIEVSYEDSPYLVVTNLDWDNIRAIDVFAILSSFAPPGAIRRVQVFQSDFGMKRMAEDKLQGPSNIWKKTKVKPVLKNDDDEEDSSDENEDGSDGSVSEDEKDPEDPGLKMEDILEESDFDPEKLRAYEASKLKYYFSIVEFSTSEQADIAYREVDGMEFEHSSSAMDLRTIPAEEVDGVTENRPLRDEATSVPSNYKPPEFIVSALQQTNVQCTWDQGDTERQRKLTMYSTGEWQNMTEADELKAYLASDASSDEDSNDEKANKSSTMRKLLGLDSDDEESGGGEESGGEEESEAQSSDNDSDERDEESGGKTLKFIPGAKSLEDKIRSKLESNEGTEELTPWQKYQDKRKQKRKDRRQAARNKRRGGDGEPEDHSDDDDDGFFLEDLESESTKKGGEVSKKDTKLSDKKAAANQELELLLAGENEEEEARDYDIRGIQRLEKNKSKKLRGSRKRKEDKIAADVSGKNFKIDVHDNRFAAVLGGGDDRFGIDKTDPSFKDTSAMREILSEQTQRRKKKRKKNKKEGEVVAPDVNVDNNATSSGASALSALVQKLKAQVSNTSQ